MPTFNPPTIDEGPVADGPLFSRYKLRRGITVIKNQDDSYSSVRFPWLGDLEAAKEVYLGGHVYFVTSEEATALTAAGYGDFIT